MSSEIVYKLRNVYLDVSEKRRTAEYRRSDARNLKMLMENFVNALNFIISHDGIRGIAAPASKEVEHQPVAQYTLKDVNALGLIELITRTTKYLELITTGIKRLKEAKLITDTSSLKEILFQADFCIREQDLQFQHFNRLVEEYTLVIEDLYRQGLCKKCHGRGQWYDSSLTAGDPYARTSDGLRHCDPCFGTGMVKTSSLI